MPSFCCLLDLGTSGNKTHVVSCSSCAILVILCSSLSYGTLLLKILVLQMPMSSLHESPLVSVVQNHPPVSCSPPSISVCCLMGLKMSLTLFFIFLLQQREMTALALSAPSPTHSRQSWGPGDDALFPEVLPTSLGLESQAEGTTWYLPILQVPLLVSQEVRDEQHL